MNTVALAPITSELDLDGLAHDLALTGARANESALAAVGAAATRAGACPVLVAVLVDRTAPEVVRARAFGRLATHLAARPRLCAPARAPELLCA